MPTLRTSFLLVACVLLVPAAVFDQASITGQVKDASGAVLPGVTVEASSPALIEKVRSVATDGTGQYRLEILPPGTYTVTFSKPGYQNKVYNNVVLSPGVVTNINAQMSAPNAVTLNGHIANAVTTNAMPNVQVLVDNTNNTFNYVSDGSGNFTSCTVVSGTYQVAAAEWGYLMHCSSDSIWSGNHNLSIQMTPGASSSMPCSCLSCRRSSASVIGRASLRSKRTSTSSQRGSSFVDFGS